MASSVGRRLHATRKVDRQRWSIIWTGLSDGFPRMNELERFLEEEKKRRRLLSDAMGCAASIPDLKESLAIAGVGTVVETISLSSLDTLTAAGIVRKYQSEGQELVSGLDALRIGPLNALRAP